MKINRKLWVRVGVVLTLVGIGVGGWYFLVRPSGSLAAAWNSLLYPQAVVPPGTLNASGTVETTVLSIAPEMPGKVLEVDFQEGDVIKAGAVLVRLDDSILKIQQTIAAASLEMAKLSLQQLSSPTIIASLEKTIAQDRQAVADALQAQGIEQYFINNTEAVQNARANLLLAKKALDRAQINYYKIRYNNYLSERIKAAAYQQLYAYILAYNNAEAVVNLWTGVPNQEQVDLKTATLVLAQARLVEDQTLLDALNGGTIPETATGAGIVKLQQTRINVQVAQASLDLLNDQIARMTVIAPVDGVVMTRSVDPGNVVYPGTELLSLARLNDLTITIYIPEESYGKITLGQAAAVTVDSFPGETFNAAVVFISKQPEFTPHTVQTMSGSHSAVYAIQVKLGDGAGKLKPGMPADVTFNTQ